MLKPEKALHIKTQLGEGPVWHEGRLFWVDIDGQKLHVFYPESGQDHVIETDQHIGALAPRTKGGFLMAMQYGLYFFDLETEVLDLIVDPEPKLESNRFNDGKCDPAGRFWGGTIHLGSPRRALASLYVLEPDLNIRVALEGVTNSNGLAWSPDQQTFYYIDTPALRVDAFDYNLESGIISNRRPAIYFSEGMGKPDGMTMDREGHLWISAWNGHAVHCCDPSTGKVLDRVSLPTPNVTSCCFGDEDLGTLYITTATDGLYKITPGVKGLKTNTFAG